MVRPYPPSGKILPELANFSVWADPLRMAHPSPPGYDRLLGPIRLSLQSIPGEVTAHAESTHDEQTRPQASQAQ